MASATSPTVEETDTTIYPYPEIGGIGVLIGFGSTTFLTVAILTIHYIAFYDPRDSLSLRITEDAQAERFRINPYDAWVLKVRGLVSRWLLSGLSSPRMEEGRRRWWQIRAMSRHERQKARSLFEKLILRLCDGHFIIGYSYLVSGFASIALEEKGPRKEQMSVYHWKILLDLAWYSASTHIAGFIFLERYFARRPVERTFRVLCVGVFAACLIFASLPKIDSDLQDYDPVLVFWKRLLAPGGLRRLFDKQKDGLARGQLHWALLSMLFMAFSFLLRSGDLIFGAPGGPYSRARASSSRLASGILSRLWIDGGGCLATWWNQGIVRPLISIFLVARLYVDLYQSTVVKILATIILTVWGTLSLYATRFAKNDERPADDDKWAFGQISAVVGSAIPICAVMLSFWKSLDKKIDSDSESPRTVSEDASLHLDLQVAPESKTGVSELQRPGMPSLLYRDYCESLWRPWASSFAFVYGFSAVLECFTSPEAWIDVPSFYWLELRIALPPFLVSQWPIMVMYALVSSSLETSLSRLDWNGGRMSRLLAWRVANGAIYLCFGFVVFCCVTDWSVIGLGIGTRLAWLGGWGSFQNLTSASGGSSVLDGLLWCILVGAVILYEVVCVLLCLVPPVKSVVRRCICGWRKRMGVRPRKGSSELLPVWRAPRTASWPARQPWRDGQFGIERNHRR